MLTPEARTQVAILQWLKAQYPRVYEHVIKIDNEGIRTISGHVFAVKMGLHLGASDLFIAWPSFDYHGLWVEVKPDEWKGPSGKKQRDHHERQMHFIEKMNQKGYFAKMVVGVDEGIEVIQTYLQGF